MNLLLSQPRIDFAAPVQPVVVFDPSAVRPGEETVYRVTFNALEPSVEFPTNLNFPPAFSVQAGGRGQMLQMLGTGMEARTMFNFHIRVATPGEYTMAAFRLRVYGKTILVPAARLLVMANPPPHAPVQKLSLELPATNLYVGQALKVRVTMPFPPGALQTLSQVQLNGEGFLVDQTAARQMFEPVPLGGPGTVKYVYETIMTPIEAGQLRFFAQGFTANRTMNQTIVPGVGPGAPQTTIAFSALQYTLLDSDPVEVSVRPLPTQGELPGFTGAIGSFTNEPPRLATNVVRVGDPVKLTVTIRGDANMVRLVPPPSPQVRDWQVFAAASTDTPAPVIHMQGAVSFNYTLVPLTERTPDTPRIPFSYFDPEAGKYRDLTLPSVAVKVLPGSVRPDLNALALRERREPGAEPELKLSGIAGKPGPTVATLLPVQQRAWFPLVQLAPALLVGSLWAWDRRRRYLQARPQVVRFRRARRALRRERRLMRRAAMRADAPAFSTKAVEALRAAAAPHFPADSKALVGADVLSLLRPEERNGRTGAAVRQLFDVTDAKRFAAAGTDLNGVLKLQPEIEAVLANLEEKLCV